jgi:hypothetical protein
MQNAAISAGLCFQDSQLLFALEPEAAALACYSWCLNLPSHAAMWRPGFTFIVSSIHIQLFQFPLPLFFLLSFLLSCSPFSFRFIFSVRFRFLILCFFAGR